MTAVAIDFGTSNTVVCVEDPITQRPRTLRFDALSRRFETVQGTVDVVPSLVFVQSPDHLVLGEAVRSQRLGFVEPDRLFQAFKRELAADFRPPDRALDGYFYSPELISEQFLSTLWHAVQQQFQPNRVILTVPVGAFEHYLTWFRDLADRLHLPDVRMVDESTAAALGYAVEQPGAIVLVVDFGGGTLDLSLVRTAPRRGGQKVLRAEVLAKSDAYVGGIDIDTWIVEHYLQKIGSSPTDIKAIGWQNLLELAERLKIRLSQAPEASESWFDDESFMAHELRLNREELAELLESHQLLEQIRQALDEVLEIAFSKGIQKTQIERVLLVGGSCQIPAVQQLITSYFGRQKVQMDKPFEAIAQGALMLNQLERIDDFLRHTYAIRLWDAYNRTHSYYPLFEQGTTYPCQRLEPLTLQVAQNGQREIRLDIGEVATVSQAEVSYDASGRMTSSALNRHSQFHTLQSEMNSVCVAHLDPPGKEGVDRIQVWFEVNDQRVLLATVKDLQTGERLLDRSIVAMLK